MITDTELRAKGVRVLAESLGDIEAERFVALIQREPFDYTKWRQDRWEDLSIDEISRRAMLLREKSIEQEAATDDEDAAAQP
jgi:hypothetical protein